MGTCPVCGLPFTGRKGKVFCSRECNSRHFNDAARETAKADFAAGLCRYCRLESDGRKIGPACRALYRAKVLRNQAERRAAGLCLRCGRARRRGSLHCALCLAYGAAWRAARRKARA